MESTFEQELARSGKLLYTNVGVSMRPLLREGRDIMVIERAEDYRVLDAVLFRRPGVVGRGAYILHRILKILPDGRYWIVGDNCTEGETVARENILGVLTGVMRNGRLVSVTDRKYRAYVRFWCAPYRLRFLILRGRRFLGRVKRWVKRRGL